jgi:hypothetical protein
MFKYKRPSLAFQVFVITSNQWVDIRLRFYKKGGQGLNKFSWFRVLQSGKRKRSKLSG